MEIFETCMTTSTPFRVLRQNSSHSIYDYFMYTAKMALCRKIFVCNFQSSLNNDNDNRTVRKDISPNKQRWKKEKRAS